MIREDDDVANLLSLILEQNGFSADIVYNALRARALRGGKEYDAMTLDLVLADGSGLDFLGFLKPNANRTTPVIIFSGEEVGPDVAREVNATLIRSETSNEKLLETMHAFITPGNREGPVKTA